MSVSSGNDTGNVDQERSELSESGARSDRGGQGQVLKCDADTIPSLKIGKIKGFILIALLLIPLNVYGFERLNAEEISLEAAWEVLHVIDYGQTLQIAMEPDRYWELNPVLGKHPSVDSVHVYMLGSALLHPVITYVLPRKVDVFGVEVPVRRIWQGISIGMSGACVVNNFSIGLGMGF